ncbi:MAG: hypothetical protein OEL56_02950 [Nitrosopumilus sp.]|nr:hypothetical protein [Nitrosopumilus sp.]MDH3489384.1 hypothetical protein [Nitrosopumilus sp.]MDH3516382.1 hypothetical protein [Nitrosopumilus sp.]MDH5553979.1 hypothetical protein [Nitrosopumilus sp.]
MLGFQMITHNFCIVSITVAQKYITDKEGYSSCDQSAIIIEITVIDLLM